MSRKTAMRLFPLLLAATLPMVAAAAAPQPGSRAAREYLAAAAGSDEFEQMEANLVLTGSRNPQVRAFAQRMIADHDATHRALRAAAVQAGLPTPPEAMGADQAQLLAGLQGLTGPDLDRTYARHQVLAHRSALTVEQGYASAGDVPALKQAAAAAVPVISGHLSAAEQLKAGLGGS
jgi:putative membrane protein